MRRWIGSLLRRWAEWVDPDPIRYAGGYIFGGTVIRRQSMPVDRWPHYPGCCGQKLNRAGVAAIPVVTSNTPPAPPSVFNITDST